VQRHGRWDAWGRFGREIRAVDGLLLSRVRRSGPDERSATKPQSAHSGEVADKDEMPAEIG
jgi:hypothetical protein